MMGLGNMGLFGSFIKEGWEKAFHVAKFFCFLHVTNTYLISPVVTYGPSMLPTMDLIPSLYLAERISARFGKVDRGDIVVVRSPQNPGKIIAKRMVGIEGDSVTYVTSPKISDKRETVVVPKGRIWVAGDNIYDSTDSRNFGPVPYGHIESRIFWKVLPLKDFGPFWKK